MTTCDALGAVPVKLLPETAGVDDRGHLTVAGRSLVDLAREYDTALYVYDEVEIRARMREAKDSFPGEVVYASKAFSGIALANLVAQAGLWWDASTVGEMQAGVRGGVPADHIVVHGNNKTPEEIEHALALGVHTLVIDSEDEVSLVESLATAPTAVWLRLNPNIDADTHHAIKTGHLDSKFGLNLLDGSFQRAQKAIAASPRLHLTGVHAHIGSQMFAMHQYGELIEIIVPLARDLGCESVSFGGGFGVCYTREDNAFSLSEWMPWIAKEAQKWGGEGMRLFVEPGRSIVARAGLTVYRVGTVKVIPEIRRFVSVDGGMSDNIRPMLYGSQYEAFLANRVHDVHDTEFAVVGKHCETGDIIVPCAKLPADTSRGDFLVTPVTGAYGFSMGSEYNRVPRGAVVFVADGKDHLAVRRQSLDEVFSRDVGV